MDDNKELKKDSWLKTVFHFAAPCKGKLTLGVIIELISVAGSLIPYIGVYNIIIHFFQGTATTENILFLCAICLLGYLIKVLCHGIATTFSHISAYTILEQIRLSMTQKLLKAPLGTVLSKTTGELKSNIIDRVETIELPLAHMIPEGISNLFLPIAVFIYLIFIDWRMALASLITVPVAVIIYGIVMKSYNKKYADFMKSSNYVNSVIVEYVEGIEVIKAFGRSGSSYEKFSSAVKTFKEYTLDWFRSTWKMMNLGGAILPSTLLGTLPIGMALYMSGTLSPTNLIMCLILSMGIVGPLTSFTVFVNDLKAIEYAINDVKKILDLPELTCAEHDAVLNNYDISIENLSFAYDENGPEVLQNINLELPQGSYTALVGPSGSGKSTIARLISRFWDVDRGSIKIDEKNIKDIPLNQLADIISFVTQDNYLFNCSLKENIRLGKPSASDEEVYAAAKAAQCDTFISALENGYDTDAGEAGERLSGGEKQRIAIARVILKNSPIVILDEATAFTDPENEFEIQKSISALTKGKTLLVIAHRLSTIKNANNIVVMNNGHIFKSGTHQELMSNCDLYCNMWDSHIGAKMWSAKYKKSVVNINV